MPVSSPSYFPPNRNSDRIVGITAGTNQTGNNVFLAGYQTGLGSTSAGIIAIGHQACGAITGQDNPVIIGVTAATKLTTLYTAGNTAAPVILGYNACQNMASADGSVVIGSQNFGQNSADTASPPYGINNSIFLGSNIANGANVWAAPTSNIGESVVIGTDMFLNPTSQAGLGNSILIGYRVAATAAHFTASDAVVVGYEAATRGIPPSSVVLGASATPNTTDATGTYLIAIGVNSAPDMQTGGSSIYIGANAGAGWPNNDFEGLCLIPEASSGQCESYISARGKSGNYLAYANVALGACTYAKSNLALAGAGNIVSLFKGTKGTSNPAADSGYLYVDGVNNTDMPLHWVNYVGADSALGPSGPVFEGTGLGVISPAQLTATENDFAPSGFAEAQVVRVTPAAGGTTLTGLAGGAASRVVRLTNISTSDSLTLSNLTGSSAANQIATPSASNLVIVAQSSVTLWYDGTSGYWRVISWA